MTRTQQTLFATVLVSTFAFAVHAETPEPAQTGKDSGKVTLTGCVERADQMSGTTATTTVDSLSFVLIHATKGSSADAPKGTAGASSASQGTMYRLAGDTSKLNPHVGHKVEVTGTLDAAPAQSSGTGDTPSPSSSPKLTVLSLKMLAETCAR